MCCAGEPADCGAYSLCRSPSRRFSQPAAFVQGARPRGLVAVATSLPRQVDIHTGAQVSIEATSALLVYGERESGWLCLFLDARIDRLFFSSSVFFFFIVFIKWRIVPVIEMEWASLSLSFRLAEGLASLR